MRTNLAIGIVILLLAVRPAGAGPITATEDAQRVTLKNDRLTISFGKAEKGAIISLVDNATGTDFAAPQPSPRLFALTFSNKGDAAAPRFTLSSSEAKSARIAASNRAASFDFEEVGGKPIHVSCTAAVTEADPLVRWRLSATFPDSLVLEEVQFPFCVMFLPHRQAGQPA